MPVIATDGARFSNLVKYEEEGAKGYTREAVTAYEGSLSSYVVGTVLGKTLVSGTATAAAQSGNTGNGTMGSITVSGRAQVGTYQLRIVKATTNAGDFVVVDPQGVVIGTGTVAVAFSAGGLAFTLADGATDFVVGDTFIISVAGTEKWKICKATATDGSEYAAGIFIADALGNAGPLSVAATTDTKVLVLVRGPAIVAEGALVFDASIDTAAELAAAKAQLKAKGIMIETTI